ncbi:MAG TPA: response regulator transcription factor [Ktedonobacteraceae bacterium]|jgi:DNA-binding response OmpR family regulator|nr:response regulator transcription factor [Ktedonobacteraceae bacterium]
MYILVVDDDVLCLELVKFTLRNCGYEVECADNPRGAIYMIERRLPDLLLLDVKMPGMDGFSFTKHLKKEGYAIPCIFLTAYSDMENLLLGFSLDAEDYITKPYHPQELIARIGVVARRKSLQPVQHLRAGSLELIPEKLQVMVGTKQTTLTPTEMQILSILIKHVGQVVPRENFFADLWSEQTSNVLAVFIRRLRNKIGNNAIVCVRGVGYSLTLQE